MTSLMPSLFVGHGNPMNAITDTPYSRGWRAMGRTMPKPQAILSISAHYYIPFSLVTSSSHPSTIHDFSGFPESLYQVKYPAPGSPDFARRIKEVLAPVSITSDDSWGLDHGSWSVLRHMFPDADIPVVQLSINEKQPVEFHYDLGKKLSVLRQEGVLIMGSGNLVHNLRLYKWNETDAKPYDWANFFEKYVRDMLEKGDHRSLIEYTQFGEYAKQAVPILDHYLPFIYVLGTHNEKDEIRFPVEGIDGGSVSMLAIQFGKGEY